MSTREVALSIFDQLNESELKAFIELFRRAYPPKCDDDLTEKQKAFKELESLISPIKDLDDEKELAEYREEKYGK